MVSLAWKPLKSTVATKRIFSLCSPCTLRPCCPFHMGSESPWQLWQGREQARGSTAAVPACVHWADSEDSSHPTHSAGLGHHTNELVGHAEHCSLSAVGAAHWQSAPTPAHQPWEKSACNPGPSLWHSKNKDPAMENGNASTRIFSTTHSGVSLRSQEEPHKHRAQRQGKQCRLPAGDFQEESIHGPCHPIPYLKRVEGSSASLVQGSPGGVF